MGKRMGEADKIREEAKQGYSFQKICFNLIVRGSHEHLHRIVQLQGNTSGFLQSDSASKDHPEG